MIRVCEAHATVVHRKLVSSGSEIVIEVSGLASVPNLHQIQLTCTFLDLAAAWTRAATAMSTRHRYSESDWIPCFGSQHYGGHDFLQLTNTVPVSSYRVTTCPLFRYSSSFKTISQVFLPLCRFLQVSPQELPAVVCVCACVKLFCTFLTIAARNKGPVYSSMDVHHMYSECFNGSMAPASIWVQFPVPGRKCLSR